eukprot:15432573-Alexandrium_andersonii.AAC.1
MGRLTHVEATTGRQAQVAPTVLQQHEATGQAQQGYLAHLRAAALSHSAAIQQLITEARGRAEQARAQQAEL